VRVVAEDVEGLSVPLPESFNLLRRDVVLIVESLFLEIVDVELDENTLEDRFDLPAFELLDKLVGGDLLSGGTDESDRELIDEKSPRSLLLILCVFFLFLLAPLLRSDDIILSKKIEKKQLALCTLPLALIGSNDKVVGDLALDGGGELGGSLRKVSITFHFKSELSGLTSGPHRESEAERDHQQILCELLGVGFKGDIWLGGGIFFGGEMSHHRLDETEIGVRTADDGSFHVAVGFLLGVHLSGTILVLEGLGEWLIEKHKGYQRFYGIVLGHLLLEVFDLIIHQCKSFGT